MTVLNPYEQSPSVENEERIQTLILDHSGAIPTGVTSTRIIVDPSGGRRVIVEQGLVRTNDGRIAFPGEQLYACINGCRRQLLTAASIVLCSRCHMPVCYSCLITTEINDVPHEVCPACVPRGFLQLLQKVFGWLLPS